MSGLVLLLALVLGGAAPLASAAAPVSASAAEELLWKGNLGGAMEAARAAAAAAPQDVEKQEMYLDILLTVGLPDIAATSARERIAATPTDPDAHYLLARALTEIGPARAEYERALKLDADHARSHMGIAALHVAAGRDDDALAGYERAVKLDPSLAEAWIGAARIYIIRGDMPAAVATSRSALEAIRDEPTLYFLAAALEPQKAKAYLQSAVSVAPRDPSVHSGLADILLHDGDFEGAKAEAIRALAINPSLVDAQRLLVFSTELSRGLLDLPGYLELAGLHDSEGKEPQAALTGYRALAARYPRSGVVLLALGQLELAMGDRAAAGRDLERAMAVEPDLLDIQLAYGMFALSSGRPDVARQWLERAWDARPWDAALALGLGQTYKQLGEKDGARRVLAEAWSVHAWDARVALAYAQALLDAGDAEGAYNVIREAARRIPDPQLGVALVSSAVAAGRYGEAAAIVEDLGRKTNNQSLLDSAAKLRQQAAAQGG